MITDVPPRVVSVRQPWAWLPLAGHKPIENRTWCTRYRGPLLVHAAVLAKGSTNPVARKEVA